jgi:hypothetical protein
MLIAVVVLIVVVKQEAEGNVEVSSAAEGRRA